MAFRRDTEQTPPPKSALPGNSLPPPASVTESNTLVPISSMRVVFCRVVWTALGPVGLLMFALRIGTAQDGWTAPADLGYFVILGLVVAARWYCFKAGDPTDMSGNTITPADLRRYTLTWLIAGVAVWVVANLIGNHVVF